MFGSFKLSGKDETNLFLLSINAFMPKISNNVMNYLRCFAKISKIAAPTFGFAAAAARAAAAAAAAAAATATAAAK